MLRRSLCWPFGAALLIFPVTTVSAQTETAPTAEVEFVNARLAAGDGDYRSAVEAFERAVAAAPFDPYIRLEYARLLIRLGQYGRPSELRGKRIQTALEQLGAAEAAAGGRLDTLREIGLLYLDLAQEEAKAIEPAKRALELVRQSRPDDPETLLPLGQIYRAQGDLPKAVETLRATAAILPGNSWVQSLLGRVLAELAQQKQREGALDQAEQMLREALAAGSQEVEPKVLLADLLSRRGEHDEAATLLLSIDEASLRPDIRQRLVWELFLKGDLGRAAEQVGRFGPESAASGKTLQVLLEVAQGNPDKGAESLAAVLSRTPGNDGAIGAVVRALVATGRRAQAESFLTSLVARLDGEPGKAGLIAARLELADLALGRNAWETVEAVLSPLAKSDPVPPGGWRLLYADALSQLGRGLEALRFLPEIASAEVDATNAPQVAKRAEIQLRLGQDTEAARTLAVLSTRQDSGMVLQAARVYQRLARFAEALPLLGRVLEIDAGSIEARYFVGVAQERLGRRPEAVTAFRELLERSPDFAPALNYLGYMWTEKGENLEEALQLVRRAVALDPNNAAYLDSLGWAHFQLGQLESARGHLERAAELLPEDATVLEHLGDLYQKLGRTEDAIKVYRRSLELEGDHRENVQHKLRGLTNG